MEVRIEKFEVSYSARGIPRYQMEIWHDGLKKHRIIRGESEGVVRLKAKLQGEEWMERWAIQSSREDERSVKLAGKRQIEERKSVAAERSAEAQNALSGLSTILVHTLSVDDKIDWDSLKDKKSFGEPRPRPTSPPPAPTAPVPPVEPHPLDFAYVPKLGLLDRLIRARRVRLEAEKRDLLASDRLKWKESVARAEQNFHDAVQAHTGRLEVMRRKDDERLAEWESRREAFSAAQAEANAAIDLRRLKYENAEPSAIVEYCDLVLSASRYPNCFPQEFELEYHPGAKTIAVDYRLPAPEDLPTLKAVKYSTSTDEFEEQHLTEGQAAKQYDEVLYQVALRTLHELFEADQIGALAAAVFNGVVTAINRSTGKPVTACVLSVRAGKSDFQAIDLAQVDPRVCFRSLKGVSAAKLHGLSAVPAIMPLQREDARFVGARAVADELEAGSNLAAMDWEAFEHLIREVFEQEFASSGGEVKVTRASRDGGVDAVAFDPDPIRGGKIVIQAKRYTSTVGVSAVRDLYGTVLNEGATKGILITTSDYGPDSYAFANGKPLVLLSGGNLLHLLEKHGHKARIDLSEAKRLLSGT